MSTDWREHVLKFWFGLDPRQWWKSDPSLDHQIKQHFLKLWAEKRQLPVEAFLDDPLTAIAAVILFDQFPRNMFRGHADQFATDPLALAIAKAAVDRKLDDQLEPQERAFLYMPFQHSEKLEDQNRSMLLFTALGDSDQLKYAKSHRDADRAIWPLPAPQCDARPAAEAGGNGRRRGDAVVSGLVEAARFNWANQAELARTFLESHGIQAVVFDTQSSLYSDGALVGVRLMVLDEDVELAQRLLAARALEQVRDRAGIEPGRCQPFARHLRTTPLPRAARAHRQRRSESPSGRRRGACLRAASRDASRIASTSAGPMPRMIGTKR